MVNLRMHYVSGNRDLARSSLPAHLATLKIVQRMQLEDSRLDGVVCSSDEEDRRQCVRLRLSEVRTSVYLASRLGDMVLPEIISTLDYFLDSDVEEKRQGVCVGQSEIRSSSPKNRICTFCLQKDLNMYLAVQSCTMYLGRTDASSTCMSFIAKQSPHQLSSEAGSAWAEQADDHFQVALYPDCPLSPTQKKRYKQTKLMVFFYYINPLHSILFSFSKRSGDVELNPGPCCLSTLFWKKIPQDSCKGEETSIRKLPQSQTVIILNRLTPCPVDLAAVSSVTICKHHMVI